MSRGRGERLKKYVWISLVAGTGTYTGIESFGLMPIKQVKIFQPKGARSVQKLRARCHPGTFRENNAARFEFPTAPRYNRRLMYPMKLVVESGSNLLEQDQNGCLCG